MDTAPTEQWKSLAAHLTFVLGSHGRVQLAAVILPFDSTPITRTLLPRSGEYGAMGQWSPALTMHKHAAAPACAGQRSTLAPGPSTRPTRARRRRLRHCRAPSLYALSSSHVKSAGSSSTRPSARKAPTLVSTPA